jgi:pSer/pThr/pTyr-binding forkhead associated (FHA) protein
MNYKFSILDSSSGKPCAHWILTPPVIVGRCPSTDIMINDASISRRHCQFTLNADGALMVRDLGSKNGVYVNQEKVDKAIVRPGEVVQIGAVSLRPEWTDQVAMEEPEDVAEVIDLGETQPMRTVNPDVIELD